ncbi:hypothetical protein [Dyadobacter alkalitolerans]|uniref:hypothetical protein n=1 Tax=Dyadobacter alkalitolerans TaxID=492736 RepID=UPI0003F4F04E|nr:hypothetical protein [Dyadobacter alkalitolerans]
MEKKRVPLVDISKVTIDPTLKSSRDSAFIQRKMEQAKKTLAGVDLSILGIKDKF